MKQITALGDSIMRGVVLDRPAHTATPRYTLLDKNFSSQCESTLGLHIKNLGRFGNTTSHGLNDLARRHEQVSASDFVVMEFGGNDCDHHWAAIADNPEGEHHPITPLAHFVAQYRALIDGVRRLGSQPVLLSLPPILSDRYFHTFSRTMNEEQRHNILGWLNNSLDNITQWHEMYNLELFKLAASLRVPIIDITSPFLGARNCRSLFCDDGIHPNEQGHRLIAETICGCAAAYL